MLSNRLLDGVEENGWETRHLWLSVPGKVVLWFGRLDKGWLSVQEAGHFRFRNVCRDLAVLSWDVNKITGEFGRKPLVFCSCVSLVAALKSMENGGFDFSCLGVSDIVPGTLSCSWLLR